MYSGLPYRQLLLASLVLPWLGMSAAQQQTGGATNACAAGGDQSFDYIIVGGGTAGLTVAARLAENSKLSVAVVEAGDFYEKAGNTSVIPGYAGLFAGTDPADTNPLVDWGDVTEPQQGGNNRRMHYARGRCLGGSSARNFMYYHRPTKESMDQWANEVGDSSFTFDNLMPYYKRSVTYTPPALPYQNTTNSQDPAAFSGSQGPVQLSYGGYIYPFSSWGLQALAKAGQKLINGFQSGSLIGAGYLPFSIDPKNAHRSSSETAFLQNRPSNLHIFNNTFAQKLVFDGTTAKQVLVKPDSSSSTCLLSAQKEIILSAGAFRSPHLLMLSGIGPAPVLENLGIKVVANLTGVGQNMWDHGWFGSSYRVNVPTGSAGLNDPKLAVAAAQAWEQQAAGPLSIPGDGVLGWEKLPSPYRDTLSDATKKALAKYPSDWPELEFFSFSALLGNISTLAGADPRDGHNYATMATALVAPLSRGSVTLNATNPTGPPLINPNWNTDPADIELAVAAFKRQRDIWANITDVTIGEEYFPGSAVKTDADIAQFIRENIGPVWHAAGTCKMGKATEPDAVVDTSMKVIGVQGLRVVDASSFRLLPPGHPQATVYALAEKVAAQILTAAS